MQAFRSRPGFRQVYLHRQWLLSFEILAGLTLMGGCTAGPDYVRPSAAVPISYKADRIKDNNGAERKGWKSATPLDLLERGPWWEIYHDAELSKLAAQVDISNQTVISSAAAYQTALQIIKEGQAGLFPTVTASYSATRSHSSSGLSSAGRASTTLSFNPVANATWDLDVWGRIRRTVESDAAAAQVSAADLQNAKLSEQAALAAAYFNLRATDALKGLYDRTAEAYKRTVEITQNQLRGGTASRADVAAAETELYGVQALSINTGVLRAQYENAIAVLIGRPPADLTISKKGTLASAVPFIPVSVPSRLLERRPDIAAAERTLQQENALIGVAAANFYPDISLSSAFGYAGATPLPIAAANEAWSLAGTAAQTIFDGGLRAAELAAARAVYDESVANYRQTVLTAFQQVENELAALKYLAQQARKEKEAIKAAQTAVGVYLDQYKAGSVAFTTVVTAQATLLSYEEALLSVQQSQLVASVSLIEALGGGWNADQLPRIEALTPVSTLTPPL